jgi:hypothetical protein
MSFLFIIFQKTFFHGKFLLKKSTGSQGEPIELTIVCTFLGVHNLITTKISKKMKKNLFLFLLLALVAMSCQKDIVPNDADASGKTAEVTPKDAVQTSLFDEQTKPLADDDVLKKINAFKAKLDKIEAGTMPETGTGTTVNDAIWNIEALVNSRYARANESFAQLASAKSTIIVALNDDGTIDNNALLVAVNQSKQKLTNQYQSFSENEKHVIAIDIRKKEPQVESATNIILEVEGVYGLRRPLSSLSFGPSDWWHWGFELGRCDVAPPTRVSDAALQLSLKLNRRAIVEPIYFTDVELREFVGGTFPNPDDMTPDDNDRDFLTYFQDRNLPNYNVLACLSPSDMNFYLAGGRTVINLLKPTGKSFINIDLHSDVVVPFDHLLHRGPIQYGIAHLMTVEPGGPVTCCNN